MSTARPNPRYAVTIELGELPADPGGMLAYVCDVLREHGVDESTITEFRIGFMNTSYREAISYVSDWVDLD